MDLYQTLPDVMCMLPKFLDT